MLVRYFVGSLSIEVCLIFLFFLLRLGLWVLGRKPTGDRLFSSCHNKGPCHHHDLSLLMLVWPWSHSPEVVWARFLHCRVLFFLPLSLLCRRKSLGAAHTQGMRGGKSSFTFYRRHRGIYINYLESFCMEDLSLRPHLFVQSSIYLHQYGYLFYALGHRPTTAS